MGLTTTQRDLYGRDGFLVLEDFVPVGAIAELRAGIDAHVAAFDPSRHHGVFTTDEQTRHSGDHFLRSGDQIRYFLEPEAFGPDGTLSVSPEVALNKIGHAMHDLDRVFARFSRTPALANVARALGFEDPRILQSMVIFKSPQLGGAVDWHQDGTFLVTQPHSVTGFWFALEDADRENGCMWTQPGAHRGPLRALFMRDGQGGTVFETLDETPWPEDDLVPLEVPAGTLVILHGRLPHMSQPNRSDRSRLAYTMHVIEGGAHYPDWNWLQRRPELPLRGFED
jgi:phytanoyl-CoA hydroxylase